MVKKKDSSCKIEGRHLKVLDFFYNIGDALQFVWALCAIIGIIILFVTIVCTGVIGLVSVFSPFVGEPVPIWMFVINQILTLIGVIALFVGLGLMIKRIE